MTETERRDDIVEGERLVFFSDAVVAMAITLLAIELPCRRVRRTGICCAPSGPTARSTPRRLQHALAADDRRTPFATRVITGDGGFEVRFTLYALVQALAAVFAGCMVREVYRRELMQRPDAAVLIAGGYRASAVAAVLFLASIPVAWVTQLAFLAWALIPVVSVALARREA